MTAVSILLPFRDAARTLGTTLRSITGQTFADWELIAVDDGSRDESAAVIASAAASDERIVLIQPGRMGLVPALNHGLSAARAPLVARMDADDVMHPERLERQVAFMHEHPDVTVAGCRVRLTSDGSLTGGLLEYVRWQDSCLSTADIAHNIYVEAPFAHPSIIMRRDGVLHAGGYREGDFPEDYELWLRLHAGGEVLAKQPDVLLDWHDSGERTSRVDPRYRREAFDRLRAEYLSRDARVRGERPVVVWGAGRPTRRRAELLRALGVTFAAWIDIDARKIGRTVASLRVQPPDWLTTATPRPFVLVYVSVHGAREQIAAWLESHGYRAGLDYLPVG